MTHIHILLEMAMCAPSAGNARECHFLLIQDADLLRHAAEIHPYGKMTAEADFAVLVCADERKEIYPGNYPAACAAAVQNMLLAVTDLALGAVWIGIHPDPEKVKTFRDLFQLPDRVVPFALIPVGYPAESKPTTQHYDPQRVHINLW